MWRGQTQAGGAAFRRGNGRVAGRLVGPCLAKAASCGLSVAGLVPLAGQRKTGFMGPILRTRPAVMLPLRWPGPESNTPDNRHHAEPARLDATCYSTKNTRISPLPLTSIMPRSRQGVSSRTKACVAADNWISSATPLDSMREATLTVSPQRS